MSRARFVRLPGFGGPGALTVPPQARGVVVCTHVGVARAQAVPPEAGPGQGAPPHALARVFTGHGLASLFVDLDDTAVPGPAETPGLSRLTERAIMVLDWASAQVELVGLRAGLCAGDLAAAAALIAATRRPGYVGAVVARGGRPDLAGAALARVAVPTLLIVGGQDPETLASNRTAMLSLNCEKRLEVVPGATHGFDEPGALETMAHLAGAWLAERLSAGPPRR